MSSSTIALNRIPENPSLKDLLDLLKKDILLSFSSHHVATIQSFDATSQRATATVNYPKTFFQLNSLTGLYEPVLLSYPILLDCPVMFLGGGGASLTFPVAKGDECLIFFNDRDIDNWFQGGTGSACATSRLHSFSDGIILVGVRSLPNVLTNFDQTRAVLQNGTTSVGVGESKVKISNEINGKLGASMTAFLNALSVFMSTCSGAIDPVVAGAATAFTAAMAIPVAPSATGPIVNIEGILE